MQLKLNQQGFSWEEIAKTASLEELSGWQMLHDDEQNTLIFCREWLRGKKSFTLHTSGSTGSPKPVIIERSQMQASARMTATALGLGKGDKALVCLNTAYVAGKMMLVRGFEIGMEMIIMTPRANPLTAMGADDHFHFTALVPMQLKTILEETPEKLAILHGMKAILVGGGLVNHTLENALQGIHAPVYSTYGMTETVSHIALRRLNGKDKSDVYEVLEGIEIGSDERGCLKIKGAVTGHHEIITNDRVTISDSKHFRWLGRIDHVINTGGVKVQAEMLEEAIEKIFAQLQIQRKFFVAGLPDERLGEKVVLIIEGKDVGISVEQPLRQLLSEITHAYAIPKAVYYLPSFYLTPTGKIAREANLRMLLEGMNI